MSYREPDRTGSLSWVIAAGVVAFVAAFTFAAFAVWDFNPLRSSSQPESSQKASGDGFLRLCNMTSSRIGAAIGYKDSDGWVSEGWWNVAAQDCEIIIQGALSARFYYVHSVDYDRGGAWGGEASMCTQEKAFTIRGVHDCAERGYEEKNFFEVDTEEETNWTIRLTDGEDSVASAE